MDFCITVRWMVACIGFLLFISNALVNGASSTGTLAMMKQKSLAHHSRKIVLSLPLQPSKQKLSKWRTEHVLNSDATTINTDPTTTSTTTSELTQEAHTEVQEVETTLASEPSESSTTETPTLRPTTPFPGFENIKYGMSGRRSKHKGLAKTLSKTSNERINLQQQAVRESTSKLESDDLLVPSPESELAKDKGKKESDVDVLKRNHVWLMPDEDLLKALTESE